MAQQYERESIYTIRGGREGAKIFQALPEPQRQQFRVIQGHVPFGLYGYQTAPVHYITMLRHPVQRVISSYFWILRQPKNNHHSIVNRMTLEEFAMSDLDVAVNQQTRFISGEINYNNAQALETAISNLEFNFAAFGIQDFFQESLLLFSKRFGWKIPPYSNMVANQTESTRVDQSHPVWPTIEERNRHDMELYTRAREKFLAILKESNATQ
jgi:hypothetical protein